MKKLRWKNNNKFSGMYFILPSFIGVAILILLPSIDVFIRSFQSTASRKFVGLENYQDIFSNTAFQLASKNTLKFVGICIPLLLIISLIIALMLNKFVKSSQVLKTAFLIPMAVPIASVVLIWNVIFNENGMLSGLLSQFGIGAQDWMKTGYSFWILVFSYIWKNLGYTVVLWLAGLNSISRDIYEAAQVDGAGSWRCFINITLPSLKPTLYTISVLSLLNSFKVFREAYLVAGNYPDKSIYLLQHLFNNWFREVSFSKIAAASVVMGVIIFGLIMLLQKAWESQD